MLQQTIKIFGLFWLIWPMLCTTSTKDKKYELRLNWELPQKALEMLGVKTDDLPPELNSWISETVYRLKNAHSFDMPDETPMASISDFQNSLVEIRDSFEEFSGNKDFLASADELIQKVAEIGGSPVLNVMTMEHMKDLQNIVSKNGNAWGKLGAHVAKEINLNREQYLKTVQQLKDTDMSNSKKIEKAISMKALEILDWLFTERDSHHREL